VIRAKVGSIVGTHARRGKPMRPSTRIFAATVFGSFVLIVATLSVTGCSGKQQEPKTAATAPGTPPSADRPTAEVPATDPEVDQPLAPLPFETASQTTTSRTSR